MFIKIYSVTLPLKSRLGMTYDEYKKVRYIIPLIYLCFFSIIFLDKTINPNNLLYNLTRILIFCCTIVSSLFIYLKTLDFSKNVNTANHSSINFNI